MPGLRPELREHPAMPREDVYMSETPEDEVMPEWIEGGRNSPAVDELNGLAVRMAALEDAPKPEDPEARKAFLAAMAAFKAECPPALRKGAKAKIPTKAGGEFAYKYAELGEIMDVVTPLLSKHGLVQDWPLAQEPGLVVVTCRVRHLEGHEELTTLHAPHDNSGQKNAIQALASTISYLERYTIGPALGLVAMEDDDGKASGPPPVSVVGGGFDEPSSRRKAKPKKPAKKKAQPSDRALALAEGIKGPHTVSRKDADIYINLAVKEKLSKKEITWLQKVALKRLEEASQPPGQDDAPET